MQNGNFLLRCRRRLVANLDGPLLLIVVLIMACGLATVYSATYDVSNRAYNQLFNMSVGFVVMWVFAQIPPQKLMRFAVPLYVLGIVLLLLTFFFGIVVNGSRRWLSIGITRIQPSEILKIAVPLMLAWYFHKYEAALNLRHYAVSTVLLLIPFALVAKQPDLGTALLIGGAGFYVIFFAGLPWKIIGGLLTIAGAAAPFLWTVLHDYQRRRILTLIDPTTDPLGSGYHIIQSTIAIGSGGIFGKGWLAGTQTHLEFIPERHTDFIFAVFSEEWGLVGNIVLLAINLPLAIPLVQLLKIPQRIMLPLVLGMGYMGTYFLNYSSFDFVLVSVSALGGYMLGKLSIPIPPLVLALILGGMTEQSFRNSLQISNGSYGIFVEKPIALTFLIMALASLVYALMKHKKSA